MFLKRVCVWVRTILYRILDFFSPYLNHFAYKSWMKVLEYVCVHVYSLKNVFFHRLFLFPFALFNSIKFQYTFKSTVYFSGYFFVHFVGFFRLHRYSSHWFVWKLVLLKKYRFIFKVDRENTIITDRRRGQHRREVNDIKFMKAFEAFFY